MSDRHPSDDALAFFQDIVEPTVAEFLVTPDDRRRGFLACVAVASMTEHYFAARPGVVPIRLDTFKGQLREESASLGWIADTANAAKHVHTYTGHRLSYLHVESISPNVLGTMRLGWPMGGRQVVVGKEGEWLLSHLLEAAMAFWRAHLGLSGKA